MHDFEFVAPATRGEVIALLAEADEDTRLIAGGTGLINLIKQRLASPARLVSLHRVGDLAGIAWQDGSCVIGALTSLLDIETDARVAERIPVLREVLHEVASPRIRSMATMGGALAHGDPNQDCALPLMALDAVVVAESGEGAADIPVESLYEDYYETVLSPSQLITAVRIPVPGASSRFAAKKFTPASVEDYACVGVCIRLDIDGGICSDARIVLGSVGPTVFRAADAEAIVTGRHIDEATAVAAAEAAAAATDPVDDARGSARYKRDMTKVWVRRLLLGVTA